MSNTLKEILGAVEVTEPVMAGALQLYGLIGADKCGLTYMTLDEALAADSLEVTEIDEGGSVPESKVINKGDPMGLPIDGEHLVGD